jgi:hypothetical protein
MIEDTFWMSKYLLFTLQTQIIDNCAIDHTRNLFRQVLKRDQVDH